MLFQDVVQAAAGFDHSLLLRRDGNVVACGANGLRQCNIPELDNGERYVQVAAGDGFSLLLKTNGTATVCGRNMMGEDNIHALSQGLLVARPENVALHKGFSGILPPVAALSCP